MKDLGSRSRTEADRIPVDLGVVIGVTIALNVAVFAPAVRDTVLRIPLGFVFACFVPGYVVVAAIYPERYRDGDEREESDNGSSMWSAGLGSGITGTERLLLAVGYSVVIVPLIGYVFNFTRWGVRLMPVLLFTSGFVILAALIAALRRRRLPAADRFRPRAPNWMTTAQLKHHNLGGRDIALNVLVIASIAFFTVSVGYTVLGHSSGEQYSELYLLEEDGGEFVDGNLSDRLEPGERQTVRIGVGNHQGRTVNYTVVVVQQTVEPRGDEMVVRDQSRLDSFGMTLENGETRVREYVFTPLPARNDSRVVWLLYTNDVPPDPLTENAEYHVHLWIGNGDRNGPSA